MDHGLYHVGIFVYRPFMNSLERFILYFRFFPEEDKTAHSHNNNNNNNSSSSSGNDNEQITPAWRRSLQVASAVSVYMGAVVIVTVLLAILAAESGQSAVWLGAWAGLLGMASLVMSIFQFLPQIKSTWRRRQIGALSIASMSIQTPGTPT